jgi:DNA-directed RNA polymerase specialized sigma24 family protein
VRKAYKPEGHPQIVSDDENAAAGLHDRENRKAVRKRVVQFLYLLIDGEEEDDEEGRGVRAPGIEDEEFVAVERRHDVVWARAHLKALVRRGEISESDYLILIGCYLYGHSLDEMAARLGMSYDATRKRRQRVLKIIQKNANSVSPGPGPRPLRWAKGRKPGRRNHA